MGFTFKKMSSYEYKKPFERSRIQAYVFFQQHHRARSNGESTKAGKF
ncbi:hypothetical protein NJT12_08700 [Flavobacterium sp. AC]|uniref:Uncharacterized protein n=1 Tax=Flavobacterium azizsancarii TaxID=2961580 RepID=A0ABT4WAZ2_9FLAO|nr:hypothetical protein [Flavobacterium azizsancarii]MDA6069697.1 hypothetical protein [Flavobacterium azizsancarii]